MGKNLYNIINRMLKKPIRGLFHYGAGKVRFPAPFIFNGLVPLKMAAHPCAANRLPKNNIFQQSVKAGVGALLLFSTTEAAGQLQPLDSIRNAVSEFITQQTASHGVPPRIKIGRLGAKLRLPRCSSALEPFLPPGSRIIGNATIGVRCNGSSPWTIYVTAYVQLFRPVAKSTRSLPRGDVISATDIEMVEHDLAALKLGHIGERQEVVGKVAKQHIAAGIVITPHMIEAPRMVRRGEQITIVASSTWIEIHATGTALADGAQGDLIKVRNSRSKKVIEAVVVQPGVVRVRSLSHSR